MKKFIFYITITSILLCGSANLFSTNKTFFNNLKKTINNNKRTTLGLSAAALTTLATIFGPKLYRKYKNYLKNLELSKDLSITKEVPKHFPVSSLPLIEPIKQEVPLIPKDTAAMPSNTTDTAVIQKPLYFNPNFLYKIKSLNEDKVFYIGSYENLLSNDIKKNTIDLCEANYEAIVAQENYTSRGFNFDKYFQSHENNIVMYNDKNETMGFIILSHQDNNVTVELLVVDEKYRGKGIAPFLIKTALEGMNYDNKENVDLITGKENRNKSARALYKKIFEKEELYYERVIKANHYKYSGKIKDTLSKINPKYILLEKMKNAQFEKIKNDKQEAKIDPVKYPQLFPNPPSKIQDDTIINGPNFPQMIKPNDKNNHEAFYVISHNEINKYEEIKKEVIKFFIQNLDEEEEITIPQINAIISKSYDNRQRVMYNSNGEIMGIIVYGEDHHRYGRTYVSETRKNTYIVKPSAQLIFLKR